LNIETAVGLVAEIAPLVVGKMVTTVSSPGPGCFLLELRGRSGEASGEPEGPPGDGAGGNGRSRRGDTGGVLGIVTAKALPLIFFLGGQHGRAKSTIQAAEPRRTPRIPGRVDRSRAVRAALAQAAGSAIASLSPTPSGSGAVLELSRTSTVGRTFEKSISINLGKGPVPTASGSVPTVTWWRDRTGRLHARLSFTDASDAAAGGHGETRSFPSLNEAACFMFEQFWPVLETERRRGALETTIARTLRRTERAIEKVKSEIQDASHAEEYRHKGQLLLTRQASVPRGGGTVTLIDYDGKSRLTIDLDGTMGVQQNAEVFFRKARKAERRGVRAPRRLRELEAEAHKLRQLAVGLEGAGPAELASMEERMRDPRREENAKPTEPLPRFRTYVVSGGWEVLVGKSERDNDALTHKVARPDDLWFHARQVAGSHVILRKSGSKSEPDRQAILEAAAIAAFHSKAGKSSKVSVSYTERRHVRKARGGHPGEAVISREKVVMVRPALPES
jgi:hypothetical protein